MNARSPSERFLRSMTGFGLLVFGALSASCQSSRLVIPDQSIPHALAEEAEVVIWARVGATDQFAKVKVRALPGWWLSAPAVLEPRP